MQGPGIDRKDTRTSFILMLCIFATLILGGIVGCCEDNSKDKKHTNQPVAQYKEGEMVYLKPDSTIGVIGRVDIFLSSGVEYRIGYKNNQGIIEYHDFTETQIYGKKQN